MGNQFTTAKTQIAAVVLGVFIVESKNRKSKWTNIWREIKLWPLVRQGQSQQQRPAGFSKGAALSVINKKSFPGTETETKTRR